MIFKGRCLLILEHRECRGLQNSFLVIYRRLGFIHVIVDNVNEAGSETVTRGHSLVHLSLIGFRSSQDHRD